MKNLLLTAFIAGAALFSAQAATETFQWSNCQNPFTVGAFGTVTAEPYSVAMEFNQPNYAGMKITKIDAYINADNSTLQNINNTSVFITSNLNGNPLRSKNVTPTVVTLEGEEVSVMTYELEEPLEIGTGNLYIGYNLNVTKVTGTGEKYPVLVDKDVYEEGTCWIKTPTLTENQWDVNGYTYGAAVIYVTIEREVFNYGCSIATDGLVYAEAGKDFEALVSITNNGAQSIDSLTFQYSINEGAPVTSTITLEEPLAPSIDDKYQVLLPIEAVDLAGVYTLDIAVTELNGQPNEALEAGGKTVAELDVWTSMPKHRPLVEEYTALECGFCPRGYVAMEYISETYPDDAVVICYHAEFSGKRDPMTVTGAMPVPATQYPTASIDRLSIIDPYYGTTLTSTDSSNPQDLYIITDMFERASMLPVADINIKEVVVNPTDSTINVTTDVTFMKKVANDQYRIGYVISCDGLYDTTWKQVNYFSRDAAYKDTPLIEQFYRLPASVLGLTFNDVAVITTNMRGIANSITNVEIGEPISNEYSFSVKDIKNIYGQSLNPYIRIHRLKVNAFLVDKATGTIVNASRFNVRDVYDAVESIQEDQESVSTEFYDLQGRKVTNPENGIYVKSEKLSDGTVRTSKVIVR